MLVPSAYMQSMSAFVAQNMGARNPVRAKKALGYGVATAFAVGLAMSYITLFHGDLLSSLFSKDLDVIAASHSYLKAYAVDCLLTPFLFCGINDSYPVACLSYHPQIMGDKHHRSIKLFL